LFIKKGVESDTEEFWEDGKHFLRYFHPDY